jgi:hypothetical protein
MAGRIFRSAANPFPAKALIKKSHNPDAASRNLPLVMLHLLESENTGLESTDLAQNSRLSRLWKAAAKRGALLPTAKSDTEEGVYDQVKAAKRI